MIDRLASRMLGALPWPMSRPQFIDVARSVGGIAVAMYLWTQTAKGRTLKTWEARTLAVVAGLGGLYGLWRAGTQQQAAPVVPMQGYGYGAGAGAWLPASRAR